MHKFNKSPWDEFLYYLGVVRITYRDQSIWASSFLFLELNNIKPFQNSFHFSFHGESFTKNTSIKAIWPRESTLRHSLWPIRNAASNIKAAGLKFSPISFLHPYRGKGSSASWKVYRISERLLRLQWFSCFWEMFTLSALKRISYPSLS